MNIVQQLKVQTGESDAMSVMFAVHPGLTSAMARYGAVCLERTAYGTCTCSEQSCDGRHATVTTDSFDWARRHRLSAYLVRACVGFVSLKEISEYQLQTMRRRMRASSGTSHESQANREQSATQPELPESSLCAIWCGLHP